MMERMPVSPRLLAQTLTTLCVMPGCKLGIKAKAVYGSPPTTDRRHTSSWMTTTMMTTNESETQNH